VNWEIKVWGKTRITLERPTFQEHELLTNAGGYCSVHYHRRRANSFIVLRGEIAVVLFRAFTWERHHLTSKNATFANPFIVPSQVTHRFEVLSSGQVIEQYWPDRGHQSIETDDIVRLSEGGTVFDASVTEHRESFFEANVRGLLRAS